MGQERVVLIKGDHSKWYEQAIFIVKKNLPEKNVPMDMVAEAEKIINNYLTKDKEAGKEPAKSRKKNVDNVLNVLMLTGLLVLAGLLLYAFLW